jgi:hypothetical protein
LLMRVKFDFFHDHKIEWRNLNFGQHFFVTLNFELIAVSVFKSSLSPAAYPLLCRKSILFNVNKSK